ncbi:MAG: hypothetical protein GQ475_05845 [Methylococcaceae bacterium]|nr:hypothetical protein [Methylococcaceae bacterium]
MSLLDVIKNLFFGEKSEKPAEEQITSAAPETEHSPVVEKQQAAPVAKAEPITPVVATEQKSTEPQIPEDSTLRRHYFANLEAQKQAVEVAEEQPVVAAKAPEPVVVTEKEVETAAVDTVIKIQIPEDSTLKRHFISALQSEIEANMPARPTDSTLQRHYDATIQTELDKLLS